MSKKKKYWKKKKNILKKKKSDRGIDTLCGNDQFVFAGATGVIYKIEKEKMKMIENISTNYFLFNCDTNGTHLFYINFQSVVLIVSIDPFLLVREINMTETIPEGWMGR